jgi:hypothetical protein
LVYNHVINARVRRIFELLFQANSDKFEQRNAFIWEEDNVRVKWTLAVHENGFFNDAGDVKIKSGPPTALSMGVSLFDNSSGI